MSAYRLLNITLTGVIGLIFLYSGFFVSTDLAITCSYKAQFGVECVSCGFSRDFAAFTHLDFSDKINPYSAGLFLFFFIQFIGRIVVLLLKPNKEEQVIRWDVWLSVVLFVVLIGPYLLAYVEFMQELIRVSRK